MQRNTKLLLVIGIGFILLAIGLWVLLSPILLPKTAEPPALPGSIQPTTSVPTTTTPRPGAPAVTPESANIKRLEDQAASFVSRVGSGSSADGFLGYVDVQTGATVAYRTVLLTERAELQQAHPATGPAYGITTRVVATNAQSTSLDETVVIVVQVQRAEDAGNPASPTSVTYKEATVSMQRQPNGTYLVSGITWKDVGM